LSVAIIVCLSHMFEHLRPSSKFFRRFFWLVMSLLQIHDVKLFHASVVLLESILKALDENGCLKGMLFLEISTSAIDIHSLTH